MRSIGTLGEPMHDPDARFEAATAAAGPLFQAAPRRKPSNPRAPYHHALEPDHEDELLLSIGQGLALIELGERHSVEATFHAIVRYVDSARAGNSPLTRDPTDAALALACLFGHQIGREFAWGWGHLRRARTPGIVLISPDFRHILRPRRLIDSAFSDGGAVLLQCRERLRSAAAWHSSGFYAQVR
ncbi:MAG TPA: hypothetical protein VK524_01270 [Polyangiaceae bacterium]|nr:hypothetical protein [Polyangiaceae bacterium]